eukprot:1757159-Rhodomonas_salina.1
MPTPSRVTWLFLPGPGHDSTNSSPSCTEVPHRTCIHSMLSPKYPDCSDCSCPSRGLSRAATGGATGTVGFFLFPLTASLQRAAICSNWKDVEWMKNWNLK